jgi:hypothetical protein
MKRTFALAILCVSTAAHADSKAWSAAKKVIPTNMEVVGGINAGTAHGSALYQNLLPMALGKAGDFSTQIDGIKADCGIDVVGSIDSIAFGLDSTEKNGTIVVAFRGTTRTKLEACAQKRAKVAQKPLTITTAGGLTKYTGMGDKDIYMRWLGADIVAVSMAPDDKDATLHATSGGVAGDHALKGIGAVNTSASLWLVSNKAGDIPGLGGKMTGAYGSANVAAGTIAVDMHFGVDDPQSATDAAAKATAQLAAMGGGGSSPIADLFRTVKVAAAGTEVLVTAQVPEKALLDLLANFGVHA